MHLSVAISHGNWNTSTNFCFCCLFTNTVMIFFVAMRNIIINNYKSCTWKLSQSSYNTGFVNWNRWIATEIHETIFQYRKIYEYCLLPNNFYIKYSSDLIAASRLFKPGSYQLSFCCTFIIIRFYSTTSFSGDIIVWCCTLWCLIRHQV